MEHNIHVSFNEKWLNTYYVAEYIISIVFFAI